MQSFMVAVQVVVPMTIMVCIGMLLRIGKLTDVDTMKKVDKLTFNLFMPVLMFYNIYKTDFSQLDNVGYILYGMAGLTIIFLSALFVVPKFVKPRPTAASFGQAIVRPNYILFGAAVAQSIYGEGNIGLVMLLGAVGVPAFNCMASVLLETARNSTASPKKLLISILKNPNIIATVLGLLVNFSGIRLPEVILSVVEDISSLSTPISFLSIGVSLNFTSIGKKGYLAAGILLRLVIIPLIFVVGGILLGYKGVELCALLILFAAPTAVSSYPMAVAMDADGDFAAQMVALTTVICLGTIFIWTLVLSAMQLL